MRLMLGLQPNLPYLPPQFQTTFSGSLKVFYVFRLPVLAVLRFGRCHIGDKFVEEIADIVRAGAGFGVALEGEGGAVGQFDALQGAVKQRAVGNAGVGGQGVGVHFKAVVLAGNHHAAAVQILHGVVGAMMSERHFAGFAAEREPQKLVA